MTARPPAYVPPDPELVRRRRRWAYVLISRTVTPPPDYGSAAWLDLPEGSPAKIAAVCRAAEAFAQQGDSLEGDLRLEVAAARFAHKQAEDEAYQARAEAHRRDWERRSVVVESFAARRTRQLAAAQPRAGDYLGRPARRLPGPRDGGA